MTIGSDHGGEERLAPVTPLFARGDARDDTREVPSPAEQPGNAYDADGWWVAPDGRPSVATESRDSRPSGRDEPSTTPSADGAEARRPRSPGRVADPADASVPAPIPFPGLGQRNNVDELTAVPGLRRASDLAADDTEHAPRRVLPWSTADADEAVPVAKGRRSPRLRAVSGDDEPSTPPSDEEQREQGERVLLKKLRGRGLSVAEARTHLRGVGISDEAAQAVVDAFVDRGYLDDAVLAEQLVYSAVSKKAQGRRAIAQALSARGIPREVVDEALAALPDDDEERALEFARTKARSMASLEPETALRRLAGQLARRGFNGGVAMNAAKQALAEHSGPRFR